MVFEAEKGIGGQVRIGKNPPKKDQLNWMIEYYEKKFKDLGIELRLGQKADAETVKSLNPDVVLIASGAKPIVPDIPGINSNHVYSVEQVLKGETDLKEKTVAVIGSGLTGLETAELLQQEGQNHNCRNARYHCSRCLYAKPYRCTESSG